MELFVSMYTCTTWVGVRRSGIATNALEECLCVLHSFGKREALVVHLPLWSVPVIEILEVRASADKSLPIMPYQFHDGIALEIQHPQVIHRRHDIHDFYVVDSIVL